MTVLFLPLFCSSLHVKQLWEKWYNWTYIFVKQSRTVKRKCTSANGLKCEIKNVNCRKKQQKMTSFLQLEETCSGMMRIPTGLKCGVKYNLCKSEVHENCIMGCKLGLTAWTNTWYRMIVSVLIHRLCQMMHNFQLTSDIRKSSTVPYNFFRLGHQFS